MSNIKKTIVFMILLICLFSFSFENTYGQDNLEIKLDEPYNITPFRLKDVLGREHGIGEFTGLVNNPRMSIFIPIKLTDKNFALKVDISRKLYNHFYNKNVSLVMFISGRESSKKIRDFISKNGIKTTVLIDNNSSLTKKITYNDEYDINNIFVMGIDRKIHYIYKINEDTNIENLVNLIDKKCEDLITIKWDKKIIDESTIDLIVMSNPAGDFTVCGCASQLYGGLSRFVYILDEYRREYETEPISILNGNILGARTKLAFHKYYLKACSSLGLSGVIPAISDFVEGYQFLELFIDKLPFISSNINSKYINFAQSRIVKTNDMTIAIIGLTPKEILRKYRNLKKDFLIEDYDKAIKNTIKNIDTKVDLIILSAHDANSKGLLEIAKNNPEIGFVINSNSKGISLDKFSINHFEPPLLELGNKGEYTMTIKLKIDNGKAKAINMKSILLNSSIVEHGEMLRYLYEYQDNFGF